MTAFVVQGKEIAFEGHFHSSDFIMQTLNIFLSIWRFYILHLCKTQTLLIPKGMMSEKKLSYINPEPAFFLLP